MKKCFYIRYKYSDEENYRECQLLANSEEECRWTFKRIYGKHGASILEFWEQT